jgi:hypothetical protein
MMGRGLRRRVRRDCLATGYLGAGVLDQQGGTVSDQRNSASIRRYFFAGASALALAAASSQALAADQEPFVTKAPPATKGELKFFVEGGADWTAGDPVYAAYLGLTGINLFKLTPKVGWNAAEGFDYRFADSPWHVSMQVRYGLAKTTDQAKSNAFAAFAVFVNPIFVGYVVGAAQTVQTAHRETHALADFAVGRDVLGTTGRDAMQVKVGLRAADLTARTNTTSNSALGFALAAGYVGLGGVGLAALATNQTNIEQRSSFRGVGPVVGLNGSVPLHGGFSFDYLADAAVLLGQQKFSILTTGQTTAAAAGLGAVAVIAAVGFPTSAGIASSQNAAVGNVDLQFGFSYFIVPSLKVGASYRVDAYSQAMTTLDTKGNANQLTKIDRIYHGPLVSLTGVW